ncbi:hypothetical protein [Bacillus sp. 1P06AnD]|uniref:hypothetical protein n=1 Tax=Bacillus sp. 1P06AnD TaxID=3132208 RepID=UPI00399F1331
MIKGFISLKPDNDVVAVKFAESLIEKDEHQLAIPVLLQILKKPSYGPAKTLLEKAKK